MLPHIKTFIVELGKIRQKGSFVQNVSIVFSGNVVNLLLQLVFAPVISRIYGPEAYGEYAYYNLIVSNIAFIGALAFPSIYILPKTRHEFLLLVKMVLLFILALTGLSLFVYLVFYSSVDIEYQWVAIPVIFLLILFRTLNSALSAWNSREKRFKKNTTTNVLGNLSSKGGTVGIGYYVHPSGLGLLFGDLIRNLYLFFTQTNLKVKLVVFRYLFSHNLTGLAKTFKKHINVPKFIFTSQLLSKWTTDIPLIVIGGYYSKEMLGLYTFAVTMLNIPPRLLEGSIKPVMFKKAVDVYNEDKTMLPNLLMRSMQYTLGVSLVPAFALALAAPALFPFIFGDEWSYAGKVVLILSIQYFAQSLILPYTDFWRVLRREKALLTINIFSVVIKLSPLLLVFFVDVPFEMFLTMFSIFAALGILLIISDLLFSLFNRRKAVSFLLLITTLIGSSYVVILILYELIYS